MAVYIHIPFCSNICSYCDFAKVFYNEELVDKYLEALEKEIKLNYKGEVIKTLYIGGGTPTALTVKQLEKLFKIIKIFKLDSEYEFTIECNIEGTSKEKLILFKENGVNRISIGVQSFNPDNLKFLNRKHNKEEAIELIKMAKGIGFKNISVDLIYGLPNQTLNNLKEDIKLFLTLNINHISCYSLIIEEHTKLYNDNIINIDEDLDYEMYQYIVDALKENNYNHYEISNFAKAGFESKHNLVYWNNDHYYGFGAGASGYIDDIRYDNTKSITNYIKGNYLLNQNKLTKEQMIENELILGLRKIKGINIDNFMLKYKIQIDELDKVKELLKDGYLVKKDNNLFIPKEYLYVSNSILINFIK